MGYIPHTEADRIEMLRVIGVESVTDLFQSLPESIRLERDLKLPPALDEISLLRFMRELAGLNADARALPCFLGAGIYDHFIPTVVDALASRGEFTTSYTPYQPEVSQGMLQTIYEYQTLICNLTGMDLANASMYDGATATAEGALMAIDITGRKTVVVSRAVHPHYREVLRTYVHAAGFQVVEVDHDEGATGMEALSAALNDGVACAVIQHPNFFGCLEDLAAFTDAVRRVGALSVISVDPISLGLMKPPGEYGADIVVGEGQGLGCPMAFGGPLLGFFTCKMEYQRRFPGRIVGATVDTEGRRGYTMTLRTREQDIRRERATSNICTNEALLALRAAIYLSEMGPQGLRQVADLCLQKAHYAAEQLSRVVGIEPRFDRPFFKEFTLRLPAELPPEEANRRLLEHGIIGGYDLGQAYDNLPDTLLLCVTEKRTKEEIDRLASAFENMIE